MVDGGFIASYFLLKIYNYGDKARSITVGHKLTLLFIPKEGRIGHYTIKSCLPPHPPLVIYKSFLQTKESNLK